MPAQLDNPLGAQLVVEDGACAEHSPGFTARRGEEPYALTPLGALCLGGGARRHPAQLRRLRHATGTVMRIAGGM
ncbi:hypothetical protein KZO11_00825 [Streptomyces anulatus]|uniref:hypothetical protein n=1 Tax=Streptomyces anulatus TaxID=1892 RepID=UPI001C5F039B|nr:hypothetical protein [Streptomyces anulatus]QYA92343.1 hypothetical protein KZO11_00825 [Streptomyces anulatus]